MQTCSLFHNRSNGTLCCLLQVSSFPDQTEILLSVYIYLMLISGREAATGSLALPNAGVSVDDDGKVVVDEGERTTAANIYAIGDVAKV